MRTSPEAFLADDAIPALDGEPDVLVVGAGPVGLFAALLLTQQGVRVQILDEERRPAARSYALALHPLSLALLHTVGAIPLLQERGHRVETLTFLDGDRTQAQLRFAGLPFAHPAVLVVPQQTLEGVLESLLIERGVQVQWNHRLIEIDQSGGTPLARIQKTHHGRGRWSERETLQVRPRFVIGADGHRSTVRSALALDAGLTSPAELFAIFEFMSDAPDTSEARVAIDDQFVNVLWPLGGGRLRWSFQIDSWEGFVEPRHKQHQFAEIGGEPFPYLIDGKLLELVAARAPWFDPADVGDIIWSAAVPFERRLVSRFGLGNVWLAGDAAHLTSPVGNQSMNIGLREAHELAWRIAAVLEGRSDLRSLQRYEHDRDREWRRLLGLSGPLLATPKASPWVRRHAERILPCIPASGETLEALLGQIGLEMETGSVEPIELG
jgi:2-polyprenyl-6-methoxyphenol hydroxylase-like FAD-dependent oxidoreductase